MSFMKISNVAMGDMDLLKVDAEHVGVRLDTYLASQFEAGAARGCNDSLKMKTSS